MVRSILLSALLFGVALAEASFDAPANRKRLSSNPAPACGPVPFSLLCPGGVAPTTNARGNLQCTAAAFPSTSQLGITSRGGQPNNANYCEKECIAAGAQGFGDYYSDPIYRCTCYFVDPCVAGPLQLVSSNSFEATVAFTPLLKACTDCPTSSSSSSSVSSTMSSSSLSSIMAFSSSSSSVKPSSSSVVSTSSSTTSSSASSSSSSSTRSSSSSLGSSSSSTVSSSAGSTRSTSSSSFSATTSSSSSSVTKSSSSSTASLSSPSSTKASTFSSTSKLSTRSSTVSVSSTGTFSRSTSSVRGLSSSTTSSASTSSKASLSSYAHGASHKGYYTTMINGEEWECDDDDEDWEDDEDITGSFGGKGGNGYDGDNYGKPDPSKPAYAASKPTYSASKPAYSVPKYTATTTETVACTAGQTISRDGYKWVAPSATTVTFTRTYTKTVGNDATQPTGAWGGHGSGSNGGVGHGSSGSSGYGAPVNGGGHDSVYHAQANGGGEGSWSTVAKPIPTTPSAGNGAQGGAWSGSNADGQSGAKPTGAGSYAVDANAGSKPGFSASGNSGDGYVAGANSGAKPSKTSGSYAPAQVTTNAAGVVATNAWSFAICAAAAMLMI